VLLQPGALLGGVRCAGALPVPVAQHLWVAAACGWPEWRGRRVGAAGRSSWQRCSSRGPLCGPLLALPPLLLRLPCGAARRWWCQGTAPAGAAAP
jgi:hypothetical protein